MLYLLESSKGDMSSHSLFVVGVCTSLIEAEKLKEEWFKQLKEKQLLYSGYELEKYKERLDCLIFFKGDESEDLNTFMDWYFKEYNLYSNEINIKEIKENTLCKSLEEL